MQLTPRPAYALRRTMPAMWTRVHALQTDLSERDFRFAPEYACINDFAPSSGRVVCQVNGVYVSRRDWWQPVRAGDVIVFEQVPQGGGSDPLRTILTIAVLVVANVYGGALGGAMGLTGNTAAAVGSAVITVAGTLLVNALLPVPALNMGSGTQGPSPTYSAAFQGNQARLGQSIPERFGQEYVFPDFAAQPYNFHQDDDQYYCAVLCLGAGEFNVLQLALDDSDIRNFQGVEFAVVGPGQTSRASDFDTYETLAEQSIAADNIVTAPEVSGQELINTSWVGAFCPVRAGLTLDTIFIDLVFPGLGTYDEGDGSLNSRTITWQVGVRLVDDAGTALEAWRVIATESLTRATDEAVRVSYAYSAASHSISVGGFDTGVTVAGPISIGRYEVRLRRVSVRSRSRLALNNMVWTGLRARLSVPGVTREDCTYVVIKARANEQLSGLSQRRFRVLAQRLIERYDTDTETWDASPLTVARNFTRNPAEVARYVMRRRGLADSRIDHVTLDELRDLYDERQDRFDFSFDSRVSFNDALTLVLRAGRARPLLRRGAVYTAVRDELQTLPVAMFVPRNMDRDSFSIDVALTTEETPDAVQYRYRDGRFGGDERVVYAQVHNGTVYAYAADASGVPLRPAGVPAPPRVQEERLDGIVGRSHALREAAYFVAQAHYRRMFPAWSTNLEGLLPSYGSLVATAHDVAQWGQSGDVVSWDAGTLTLTTTEPLVWTEGGTHYVRLQTSAGGVGEAILATPGAEANEMVLDEAPAETPVFDRADRERTRYLFGELADVSRYARLMAIRPQGQTTVRMEAVIDDARVHSADAAWLPMGAEVQDPLPDGTYVPGGGDAPALFVEDFESGIDGYAVTGPAGTFELVDGDYGQSLRINAVSPSSEYRLSRDITPVTFTEASWRFRVLDFNTNDPGIFGLYNSTILGSIPVLTFNPARDAGVDGQRRMRWTVLGNEQRVGNSAVAVGVWYRAQVLIVPGAGNTTLTIFRESDGQQVAHAGLTFGVSSITADHIRFYVDDGTYVTSVEYDDITLS